MRRATDNPKRQQILRRSKGERRGAVTVEFAMVVPLVFTLFFGSIEMCWLNMMRNTIGNAAYEAARRAAIPGGDAAAAQQTALDTLMPLNMHNGLNFTYTDLGDEVEVQVKVPVAQNSWGITKFTGNLTVNRTVRLAKE